jgi:hypothetical protein
MVMLPAKIAKPGCSLTLIRISSVTIEINNAIERLIILIKSYITKYFVMENNVAMIAITKKAST